MKIISVASIKGGVGKTTTIVNLGNILANTFGKKVLVCDFDAQSSLTDFYLREVDLKILMQSNSYHALTDRKEIKECVYNNSFLDVLPATLGLNNAELEMAGDPAFLLRLKDELKKLKYDFILIDTPPRVCFEFRCALYSSDLILVPISLDRWVIQGLEILNIELRKKEKTIKHKQPIYAIPFMVSEKEFIQLNELIKDEINITNTFIKKSNAVKTAINKGIPLDEKVAIFEQFKNLSREILKIV